MAWNSDHCRRCAPFVTALALAASNALAGGVGNVSHSPIVVHTELQAAIDAAADGDVLLVHGGTYSGFTIDNRSLAIFGVPGETVDVQGRVEIKNLTGSRRVVLSNIDLHETIASGIDGVGALQVSNCTGLVWIQGCLLAGADGKKSVQDSGFGGSGIRLSNASSVVCVNSTLTGGAGGDNANTLCCWLPGDGGEGLYAFGTTRVALYGCNSVGGHGGNGGYVSGNGGRGISLTPGGGQTLLVANCNVTGGDGGDCSAEQNGFGGDGMSNGFGTGLAYVLDSVFLGGHAGQGPAVWPGADGVPIYGTSTALAPTARTITVPSVARGGTSVQVALDGQFGDAFWVPNASEAAWLLSLPANGVWTLRYPAQMSKSPLAVLVSTPTTANWITPNVPSGSQAALRFSQGYALPAAGGAVLASPVCTLILAVDALPDCDANGVFDVLDVVEGAPDVNANFKPDVCEPQPTWYVDDSAPPGGDGSLASPFQTIQQGLDACLPGRTVEVLDGIYTGASNRDLDFGGKQLTLRSTNGAGNCVVDCQDLGRAVNLHSGESPGTRIEGFTIRNGDAPGTSSNYGGAISIESGACLDLVGCSLETSFSDYYGGAVGIRANAGSVTIRDCAFLGNSTPSNLGGSGGGAIRVERDATIVHCLFAYNSSNRGGAIQVYGGAEVRITHSSFLSNDAFFWGGAIAVETSSGSSAAWLRASNLLLAGNTSQFTGGALSGAAASSAGPVRLDVQHSTFAGNATLLGGSSTGGGALSLGSATANLRNVVCWQNTSASSGAQARLGTSTSILNVDYCDFDGGISGIQVGTGTLNWGSGNFTLDPKFTDPDGPDDDPLTFGDNVYRLGLSSPCLDAGDTTLALADVTDVDGDLDFAEPVPFDLNLKPRFTDLPSIPNTGIGSPPIDLGCYERQN